jgi:hypothetical protein
LKQEGFCMKNGIFSERMKGVIIGMVAMLVLLGGLPVLAQARRQNITVYFSNIQVAVDGRSIALAQPPFVYDGRTFLPVRDVADAVGFDATWEEATNTVHLTSRTSAGAVPNYPAHTLPPATQQPTAGTSSITIPVTITPRAPARSGGPANPAISARQAVEMARDHLIAIGVTEAQFDYIYMDRERGTWVWSVEFDGNRRSFEFYIDVQTGEFLNAPR